MAVNRRSELVVESQAVDIHISGEIAGEAVSLFVGLLDVAAIEEEVGEGGIESQLFGELVSGAEAEPEAVGVRQFGDAEVFIADWRCIECDAGSEGPFFVELVLSSEGEAPVVPPFHFFGTL